MSVPKEGTNVPETGKALPCPFCGVACTGGTVGFVISHGDAHAYCETCGACGPFADISSDPEAEDYFDRAELAAVAAWNRRTT